MDLTSHLVAAHGLDPRQFDGLDLGYFHDDLHAHGSRADHRHDTPVDEPAA